MEAVKAFNSELSALYDVKPPISKAKMTAITRGAIKAIKFYKHVVQSVEKFILKCKPEYKVPGLYVIDSIVRQSRHQFGAEKDVFAPRFSKNLQQTFINLFKCPPEDKSKIIRVLNLWQKNQVFAPEVIQPLFDFADPNNPIHQQIQQQSTPMQSNGAQQPAVKGSPALQRTPTKVNQSTTSEAATPNLNLTEPVLQQLQQLQRLLTKGNEGAAARPEVHFDKKLLDFDYGEDEDEVNPSPRPPQTASTSTDPVASLLTNPEVLRQLQTLQSTLAGAVPSQEMETDRIRKLQEMKLQEDEFDKHLAQTVPNLPFAAECDFKVTQSSTMIGGLHFIPPQPDDQLRANYDIQHNNNALFGNQNSGNEVEVITLDHDDSHSDDDRYTSTKRKRSRSRSRSRGRDKDRRRRSRSRSRSRSRGRRHRSRSKDRKDKDKKEKEKESEKDRERKKRGLPVIKDKHLSVCSTTLWVGHLSKLCHQDDLSNTFGEFGDIVSIDLIIPRGCAFIVMHRRQDAARCLTKLKNHVLHGRAITLAWAPGKGVKGKDLKDYWEGDLGVSYIPYNKLKEDMDLDALEDGGTIDEDTMPDWMRKKVENLNNKNPMDPSGYMLGVGDASLHSNTIDTSQPPPLPPTSLMQPMMSLVNPFQMNNRFLGVIPNVPNLANLPLGVPPPNMAPPPSVPPSMMSSLGLGINSPFQGPPGFMPPSMPPPQQAEIKPALPPGGDSKMRESLMNLAGPPLTLPPQMSMSHPPPHHMDDNMDVEMEDAIVGHEMNKPPPNMLMGEQLHGNMLFGRENRGSDNNFPPGRRDRGMDRRERSNERGRRRSRSRDRDRDRNDRMGRDRDRRDRDNVRDRDFGRGGGRDRERDNRRGGDRDRGNRWGQDRRDDRPPPDRRDDRFDRRPGRDNFERKDGRRDGPDRRDGSRDKSEREKSLNERLKEMAGISFDGKDDQAIPPLMKPSDSKEDASKEALTFEPPAGTSEEALKGDQTSDDTRNPSPPGTEKPEEQPNVDQPVHVQESGMDFVNPEPRDREFGREPVEMYGDQGPPMDDRFGSNQGYGHDQFPFNPPVFEGDISGSYGPDGFRPDDRFGPEGRFGPDGPPFRDSGPPYVDEAFRPPADMMMDGPPGFGPEFGPSFDGPPNFDGPPDRFARGGRRGRGRGRGRGRDGPDFYPREEFGPPIMDDGFGPPMHDEFGDFGVPMRNDFGPPIRGDEFGPRGMRMRGRGFFNRGGPRGRGGPPYRDGPPGFNPEFDVGPPDFFRGGPRGRAFGEPFGRGRGRGFRGGRGGRPDFFDGPPEFFDGPPGAPPFEDCPPGEEFDARRGRAKKKSRSSRWGGDDGPPDGPSGNDIFPNAGGDGGGTPLRDEIDDPGTQLNFEAPIESGGGDGATLPPVQESQEPPPVQVQEAEPANETAPAPEQD